MTQPSPNFLVFIDVETTGLDPDEGDLLELATVVTNQNFDVLYSGERVFEYQINEDEGYEIDPVVLEMHEKSGLWDDCELSTFQPAQTQHDLIDDLETLGIVVGTQPMVGNTIHFDRAWLKVHMPDLEAFFHYRNIDISTMTQFAERYLPDLYEGRPKDRKIHRALPDVFDSIANLKYYQQRLRNV